jgi:hypothetical protein
MYNVTNQRLNPARETDLDPANDAYESELYRPLSPRQLTTDH